MNCPRCHQDRLVFDWTIGTMRCESCGHRLYEDDAPPPAAPEPSAALPPAPPAQTEPATPTVFSSAKRPPIAFDVPVGMDLDALPEQLNDFEKVRMRGRLETVMYALAQGRRQAAYRALKAALDISPDYADGWLQLAALAEDADEQRACLEHVLASQPGHTLAMQTLARLDGTLPDSATEPPLTSSQSEPGQVATQTLKCPQCGGRLTYREDEKEVICHFCGFRVLDADDLARTDRHETLLQGNLKRKQQAVAWNIGQRWLRCDSCGAITTLSRQTLTSTCRFCQSRHVLQENVNLRFEQPDLIVPFGVSGDQAGAAISEHLGSGMRRLTRLFADEVDRITLEGVYLPFWVFDADMVVNWSWTSAPAHGKHPILLSDVLHLAAPTPSRDLLEKVEPFDLRRGVDYDPRLLATYPALLYSLDLTQASIDVRTRLTRLACREAEPGLRMRKPRGFNNDDDPGRLQTNASTQFMTYRFALLPIWIGFLLEADGDRQPVLVNGQTGKVALGPHEKAS